MKLINLLPKDEQKEFLLDLISRKFLIFWIWVISSFVVLFGLIYATKLYIKQNMQTVEAQISESESILNSSDYKDIQDQIQQLNRSIAEVNNLRTQRAYWSRALVELDHLIPAEVQLNQVFLNRATGQVEINGQARSRDKVIELWSNVIKSDYFENINFPLANLEKPTNANFNFTFYIDKEEIKKP